ncbi:hypothetical protein BKA62DRAFT_784489 [Auriculariales sp. MPI-PUGE-AT-0066]|nr:hypothetical protein BKA62DRAFT_784489 [Auriculariales sp. MPI-PUGE-AT-0066]
MDNVHMADEDNDISQTSDFVKRLHNMLDQHIYPGIIEWTHGGDAFVVKDMGAFVTTVSPRQFKHSNFASFVRQLNKYDFHKIKASDADAMDEGRQAWVFKHPNFSSGSFARLELVKRKIPQRKTTGGRDHNLGRSRDSPEDDVREELDSLRVAYQSVSSELASMQRTMNQQKRLIALLYGRLGESMPAASPELSPKVEDLISFNPRPAAHSSGMLSRMAEQSVDIDELVIPSIASTQRDWNLASAASRQAQWTQGATDDAAPAETTASAQARSQLQKIQQQQLLTVSPGSDAMPTSYTPMWSTKPRVLLVEDDPVSRTVTSRLLSYFGCSFDIAQDGIAALELMERSRYDLVLMDIIMPRLDGVATAMRIRQFDSRTPIISMTGNALPADVVKYISNGMNDVLCKPFTREGLESILEKHLIHLRSSWDMKSLPRSPTDQQQQASGMSITANGASNTGDEFMSFLEGLSAPMLPSLSEKRS